MGRTFDEQWSDFKCLYGTRHCPFCKDHTLDFSSPKFGNVAGIDIVAVSCCNCGHVELFNVAEVKREGDRLDKENREKGWR